MVDISRISGNTTGRRKLPKIPGACTSSPALAPGAGAPRCTCLRALPIVVGDIDSPLADGAVESARVTGADIDYRSEGERACALAVRDDIRAPVITPIRDT